MPSLLLPQAPHYVPAPRTQEELEYADLTIIDLSKANTVKGRQELAVHVRSAMTTQGFFYAVNHGYTQTQRDRVFDIADVTFSDVSDEEKKAYEAKGIDCYDGYKPRQYWKIEGDVKDQVEHYNINRDVTTRTHPQALRPFIPEIEAFAKHNHFGIVHQILRLLAIGLELPEEAFVDKFQFHATGESSVRFMKYYPRSEEEEVKTRNVWLKGHTDIGGVSILWSQPVAALQILSADGKWRWIKHIDNALVVNIGDALDFLSGSYYKATIHRVIQPPPDQHNYTRLGVFYFAMPDDDVKLVPLAESPVLQREGIRRQCADEDAPTMEVWRKGRISAYGRSELKKAETGHEVEIINGVLVTHYN